MSGHVKTSPGPQKSSDPTGLMTDLLSGTILIQLTYVFLHFCRRVGVYVDVSAGILSFYSRGGVMSPVGVGVWGKRT